MINSRKRKLNIVSEKGGESMNKEINSIVDLISTLYFVDYVQKTLYINKEIKNNTELIEMTIDDVLVTKRNKKEYCIEFVESKKLDYLVYVAKRNDLPFTHYYQY